MFTADPILPSCLMKKLFASVLAMVGLSTGALAQPSTQMIDAKSINFTTPTLSNELAELEPLGREPTKGDLTFHEDEWAQVEFLCADQLHEVKRILGDLKSFEMAHRVKYGWTDVYIRRFQRKALIEGEGALQHLHAVLGVAAGPAPVLFSSGTVAGRVRGGASFDLGGKISLYTSPAPEGVLVLGANVGRDPDNSKLVSAFAKLSASDRLVLVDWRQQFVLIATTADGRVDVWRP